MSLNNYSYTSRNPNIPSYTKINLTSHCRQRAFERLNVTSDDQIKRMAHAAKYKGVKIKALSANNYAKLGVSYDLYRFLKNHYTHAHNSEAHYYYKGYVYCFAGGDSRTLKSIVDVSEEKVSEWSSMYGGRMDEQTQREQK